jgi:hypothetical protein
MLVEALKAEATDYVERAKGQRDDQGRALVVRNGRANPRVRRALSMSSLSEGPA